MSVFLGRAQDFKYDILKHPNVKLTTDGGTEPYRYGEDTRSIAAIQFYPRHEKRELDSPAPKNDVLLLSEEELEEKVKEWEEQQHAKQEEK